MLHWLKFCMLNVISNDAGRHPLVLLMKENALYGLQLGIKISIFLMGNILKFEEGPLYF